MKMTYRDKKELFMMFQFFLGLGTQMTIFGEDLDLNGNFDVFIGKLKCLVTET